MRWVLAGLVIIIIAWALWLKLNLQNWVPIVANTAVALAIGIPYLIRSLRERRAASALKRLIGQQGALQGAQQGAGVQDIEAQVESTIGALKMMKVARGDARGASAIFSLPLYVLIGPSGAGKTTAVEHSGLLRHYFTMNGIGRSAVEAHNCGWGFTSDAILLDTPGRYVTEQDDHDEWLAVLRTLNKHRSRNPVNGVLVVIGVDDVVDASELRIEAMGQKLRARIYDVMTQIHLVVPVYIMLTKCDRIDGFVEFFSDMMKDDRAQPWGATLRLDTDKTDVGHVFEAEFDVLTQKVHSRALRRLATEENDEVRKKLYQFPLEFAGTKRKLSELIQIIFTAGSFQWTPLFRGFYFMSSVQEGQPIGRVYDAIGRAIGVRAADAQEKRAVESKSYFLHETLLSVVFPDRGVATRSEYEQRWQELVRFAVSAAAAALAVIVAIPGIVSFAKNRVYLRETGDYARAASAIQWDDGAPATMKLDALEPLLARLIEMDKNREEGPPAGMGWAMYQVEAAYTPAVAVYVSTLQEGFARKAKMKLESRLKGARGEAYLRERLDLKMYLMLSDVENLDVEWATGRFTSLWAEILRQTTILPEVELKERLAPYVEYYFTQLKTKKVLPLEMGEPEKVLVATVRKTLQGVPVQKRYYDQFVNTLINEKVDEASENVRANRRYPPLTLNDLFMDRPEVLKFVTSIRMPKEKSMQEVEGPYTQRGHWAVVQNIAEAQGLLTREQWVVPLTPDEQADRVPAHLSRLADDYDTRYIEQWTDWLVDVTVAPPANVKEAIALYSALVRPEWPYLRILRALEEHTQWKKGGLEFERENVAQAINQKPTANKRGLRFDVDIKKLGSKISVVPGVFRRTVDFAVPAGSASISDTPLAKYISLLEGLRDEMQKAEDVTPGVDARQFSKRLIDVMKQADALLQPFDEKTKTLLRPLLLNPLQVVAAKLPPLGDSPSYAPSSRFAR